MNQIIDAIANNSALGLILIVGIAAIAFFFLQPVVGGENAAARRLKALTKTPVVQAKKRRRSSPEERRRQIIQEGLKQIDRRKTINPKAIEVLLDQAGLSWSKREYLTYSIILGAVLGVAISFFTKNIYIGFLVMALASWQGLKFFVGWKRKKRFKAFIEELPNALDQLVRGVKAGLGTNDCFRMIAREAKEPVRGEFAIICDAQALGITTADAVNRMAERVPTPETNFLAIAISLQASSGGRLSEALENLSKTLRERKAMRGKIASMSMEAKASTAIIGSMPIVFIGLIYLSQPAYIMPLFTTTAGQMCLAAAGAWMSFGLFVITKMSQIKV